MGKAPLSIGSQLLRTGSVYAFASLANRAASFVLIPIYTRYLSPSEVGVVSLAEAVASVLLAIASLGLTSALGLVYFRHAEHSDQQKASVGTTMRLALGSTFGFGFLAIVFGPVFMDRFLPHYSVRFFPYITLAVVSVFCAGNLDLPLVIARSQKRAGLFATLSLSHFGLSNVLVLLFVVALSWGPVGMLSARAAGAVVVSVVGLWTARRWLFSKGSGEARRAALRIGAPLVPHQLIAFVLTEGNRFFLEHYRSVEEVGLYSLAHSVGAVMNVVGSTVMLAWSPVFFEKARQGGESVKKLGETGGTIIGGMIVIASIGVSVGPLAMKLLFDSRYASAAPACAMVVTGFLFHGLFSVFHLSVMQHGKTEYLALITAWAACVNLAANYFLVPRFGLFGSAWATLLGYLVEFVVVVVVSMRLFPVPYPLRKIAFWLTSLGVVLIISQWRPGQIPSIVAGITASVALAAAVVLGTKRYLRSISSSG